jgi:hypothetical protein
MRNPIRVGRGCLLPRVRQQKSAIALGVFTACALALGCGGPSETSASKPIEACERYEAAFKACFHREVAFMSQAALRPKTEAARERMAALCSDNLGRIQQSCR